MTVVQLACGQEDRMSKLLGPYDYVEITYGEIWTPDRGEVIAHHIDGWWWHNGERYSDITFSTP